MKHIVILFVLFIAGLAVCARADVRAGWLAVPQ